MAAYHKVEVSLNTNAVEVGIPSPQSITVTVPTVGPVGPQGPAGPKGDPGEVSGSIAWDNVTDKPSTFTPSSHTHHGNEVYLGVSGDDAPALLSGFSDTSINGVYWPQDFLINGFYVYKKNKQYGLFNENQTWHVFENVPITANIVESSDNDGADLPWVAAAWNGSVSRAAVSDFGVNAAQQFVFVGDNIPSTQVTGLSIPTASSATPQALGVAAAGTSSDFARADHVHAMPSAADVGAAAATHASTHHTGGTDALAAHQINGQTIFGTGTPTYNTDQTLGAARALQLTVSNTNASGINLTLPAQSDGTLNGDTYVVIGGGTLSGPITVRRINLLSPLIYQTLATITATGQQYRFRASGGQTGGWTLVPVDTHTHAASAITSGTLTHERGGLEADVSAYNGLLKIASGSTSAVTVTAAGEALLDDADASAQRTTLGLGNSATLDTGTTAGTVAEGNHTHADLHTRSHAVTSTSDHTAGTHKVFYSDGSGQIQELALGNSGEVLTSNGATSAPSFAAAAGGDTVSIDASAADVLTATSGAISADDGGTIDSSDPFIKWDDTAGKLVYANPLSRPSGAFYVGLAPTTTALGTDAVNIQPNRSAATRVASGLEAIAIGNSAIASNVFGIAIGRNASSTGGGGAMVVGPDASAAGSASITLGYNSSCAGDDSMTLGNGASCAGAQGTVVGRGASCSQSGGVAIGYLTNTTAVNATGIGNDADASLRGQFVTRPFSAIYWGGQTTNATATILNLDAAATNRFTIAANTALAVDILLVARRSDTADKWLVARRFLGIRRDGSNNTSLIGSVQTLGTDQSEGSPSWSFTLTADDTNEALQLEVTGATSETVVWRATAFYRVV